MINVYVDTESLICSLFLLGYDRFDSTLCTMVLGYIYKNLHNVKFFQADINGETYKCQLKTRGSDSLSEIFEKCVDFGLVCKIKEGYTLDSVISSKHFFEEFTLRKFFSSVNNLALASYIQQFVDIEEIMGKKETLSGLNEIENTSSAFVEKGYEIESYDSNDSYQKKLINPV